VLTVAEDAIKASPSVAPVGTIVSYNPGYYTNGSNGSFTVVGPAGNTVAQVNAYLPSSWRVCDGSALNDADSPIFNASGRHLPNLTNSRFVMGATTAGTPGGAATVTLETTNLPSHSHTIAHTHSINHDHASQNTNPTGSHGGHIFSGATHNISTGAFWSTGNDAGSHSHSLDLPNFTGTSGASSAANSGNTGSGTAFNILPTYLTTYYIMRVK